MSFFIPHTSILHLSFQFYFSKFYPLYRVSITIQYFFGGFLDVANLYLTHFLFEPMYIDFLALALFNSSQ